jgi:DNA polymerase-3 subunit epsilon
MLIIYDTETTGLVKHPSAPLAKQPRVIEFGAAALSLKNGKVMAKFKQLIDPGMPITKEITEITGITSEDMQGAPSFPVAWKAISKFLKPATALLAHNEPFDNAVLSYELQRAELKYAWPRVYCTIGLYREQWGRDMKLTELYEHFVGKPLDQKHRALSDVEALVEIIQKNELWRALA